MTTSVVAYHTKLLRQCLHLWFPHLKRAAKRIRQHQRRFIVTATDGYVKQTAVGIDHGHLRVSSVYGSISEASSLSIKSCEAPWYAIGSNNLSSAPVSRCAVTFASLVSTSRKCLLSATAFLLADSTKWWASSLPILSASAMETASAIISPEVASRLARMRASSTSRPSAISRVAASAPEVTSINEGSVGHSACQGPALRS